MLTQYKNKSNERRFSIKRKNGGYITRHYTVAVFYFTDRTDSTTSAMISSL
jgi:hypothetical protein